MAKAAELCCLPGLNMAPLFYYHQLSAFQLLHCLSLAVLELTLSQRWVLNCVYRPSRGTEKSRKFLRSSVRTLYLCVHACVCACLCVCMHVHVDQRTTWMTWFSPSTTWAPGFTLRSSGPLSLPAEQPTPNTILKRRILHHPLPELTTLCFFLSPR